MTAVPEGPIPVTCHRKKCGHYDTYLGAPPYACKACAGKIKPSPETIESCLRREAWERELRSHRTWGSRECDHPEWTHGDYTDGFEPVFWCDHCGATAVGYADGEPDWEHATWPEED